LIWERLQAHVATQPGKPAIACGDVSLTYAEFAARAEGLAHSWLRQGLEPGDRIALHLRNGTELAVCYYACFAAGYVAVPVNNRFIPDEIAYVLQHSGARAYVAQADLRVPVPIASAGFEADKSHPVSKPLSPGPNASDAAMLLYTSGTTARPKGVIHSQSTLAGNVSYMEAWGVTSTDHNLLFTPMVHASGCIMQLVSSISIGAMVTIVPQFEAATVLDTWERSGATFCMALPTLLRAMLAEQRARPRRISTGRIVICGGDSVPVRLQDEYATMFGHPIVEGYGLTEGLPLLANGTQSNRPGSMGRPMGDVEVRVVDEELWVRGSGVATGYWREEPFEEGWLKTGDLVDADADGFISFRGRKKEIIVRGGSNISPQEVEDALYKHPAVAEAGVIGQTEPYWGEVVVAYVTMRDGHTVSETELLEFSRQHLAEYKCPVKVVFVGALPKGPTGKVQRRSLRELQEAESALSDTAA
jgi:long-chain acyl-CoA synthetase